MTQNSSSNSNGKIPLITEKLGRPSGCAQLIHWLVTLRTPQRMQKSNWKFHNAPHYLGLAWLHLQVCCIYSRSLLHFLLWSLGSHEHYSYPYFTDGRTRRGEIVFLLFLKILISYIMFLLFLKLVMSYSMFLKLCFFYFLNNAFIT